MTGGDTPGAVRVPALAPGDRAPNLTLPDLRGRARKLYLEIAGGPIVVVTAPDPAAGPGRSLLDGLSRRSGQLRKAGAHSFVLTRRPPADPDELGALIWIDPYGDAMALFRPTLTDGAQSAASAAVLDANQRLVAVFTAEEHVDPVGEAVRRAESLAAGMAADPRDLDRTAPVLVLPRLLPPTLCATLAGLGVDQPVRDPGLVREVAQRLGARLGNEIRRTFQFRPVLRFDPFNTVAASAPAARGADEDQPRRRFKVLVGLGAGMPGVAFPEFGPHVYRLQQGAVAAFSCELLYRLDAGLTDVSPILATTLSEPASQA